MAAGPPALRAKKLAIQFGADATTHVDSMLARQNLTGMTASRRNVKGGAIGCLGNVALSPTGNVCFFTGLPINGPAVKNLTDSDAATRLFPTYDGAFAGVYWDDARQLLVVVTDCLGMQPLYMRRTDDELTIVSETKAVSGEPDLAAWGAFISIGHPIGARSLMRDVSRVPPASILTFDGTTGRLDIRRYWQWPAPSDAWRHFDFLAALERDICACAALGDPGTLLLSGGFDSRLLLFLLVRANMPASAVIVAHDDELDDADGRLAERVARLAGIGYAKARPRPDFYASREYLDYLRASDAGFPSMDLFIAKVASQIRVGAIWDGLVPGFVFMPLHQPAGGFDAYLKQEIRGADSAIWQAARLLFRPEVAQAMQDGFASDLHTGISRLPHDDLGLARFVIENRSRNRAAMNPLKVYANRCNAFTPGLSREFMSHAAIIPSREKAGGRFYRSLLARLDRRSLALPFLSGGNLMKGTRGGFTFSRERLRAQLLNIRSRHPRFFPGAGISPPRYSTFLGPHLIDHMDPYLNPELAEVMDTVNRGNQVAWKLLFHWQAWRALHANRLDALIPPDKLAP